MSDSTSPRPLTDDATNLPACSEVPEQGAMGLMSWLTGSVPEWDASGLTDKLHSQQFSEVMDALDGHIDTTRDPRAVNWCVQFGYKRGHVCVLYKLTRNMLAWNRGRVPSIDDLGFALRCALILLLRVAQDVKSCLDDMAKADLEFVYKAFRDKLWRWISGWKQDALPAVGEVAREVERWAAAMKVLPLPVWATSFRTSSYKRGFTWTNPAAYDTSAFQKCKTISDTRNSVTRSFMTFLKTQSSWADAFRADIVDVTESGPSSE